MKPEVQCKIPNWTSTFAVSLGATLLVMAGHEASHCLVARSLRVRAVFGFNLCRLVQNDVSDSQKASIDVAGPLFNVILIAFGLVTASRPACLLAVVASLHRLEPMLAGIILPSTRSSNDEYRLAKRAGTGGTSLLALYFGLLCFLTARLSTGVGADALAALGGYTAGVIAGRAIDGVLKKAGYFDGGLGGCRR